MLDCMSFVKHQNASASSSRAARSGARRSVIHPQTIADLRFMNQVVQEDVPAISYM
jgi:hypothetical protein